MVNQSPILPPATLGVLGGGQLGRMFAQAARTMGYNVAVLDPDPTAPAAHFATQHICAQYDDEVALLELAQRCPVVTTEFENPPAHALEFLAKHTLVRPNAQAVSIAQDRIKEKSFFKSSGFPVGPFAILQRDGDDELAATQVAFPAILKTARFGYDGKGQVTVRSAEELRAAWAQMKHAPAILEERLALQREVSVVLARSHTGEIAPYPVVENRHANGILDVSITPADIQPQLLLEARDLAQRLAAKLEYVGVMAVEFFVVRSQVLINEIAPRPHNSGHFTINACATSQFEQQVRAITGLPLGATDLLQPAVMVNLLGDVWGRHGPNSVPDWANAVLNVAGASLHLYGKTEPRRGRKMGHINVLDKDRNTAIAKAMGIREKLGIE
jgi:5-(carboxyamino)imidazole ribonucleotide synthase